MLMIGIYLTYAMQTKKGSKTFHCQPMSDEHFCTMLLHLTYRSPDDSCVFSSGLYNTSREDGGHLYGTDTVAV